MCSLVCLKQFSRTSILQSKSTGDAAAAVSGDLLLCADRIAYHSFIFALALDIAVALFTVFIDVAAACISLLSTLCCSRASCGRQCSHERHSNSAYANYAHHATQPCKTSITEKT